MTDRLYYENSYLKEFTANVVARQIRGDIHLVELDRTLFYPTSGGQPHDTGMLGIARVLDVEEDDSGSILHTLDSEIPTGPVTGSIDWERRFDFMQQHTGQHILSQAFIQTAGAATLSFHLGQDNCTIDVGLAQPTAVIMHKAEDLACNIVFENRGVRILMVDRADLATLGIRKETQREGEIRIIEVEGFDRSACGGTHVRSSGEVGVIAILGFERYKGGTRVEFACGGRALKTLRKDHEVLKTLGMLYSGHPYELPRLAEKLLEERCALARENSRLQELLLEMEASNLIQGAEKIRGISVVQARFAGRALEVLKVLAQKIAAHAGAVAILSAVQDQAQVVVARSSDLQSNCGTAIKETASKLGGKGGGRPESAQAGGIEPAVLDAWFQSLAEILLRE